MARSLRVIDAAGAVVVLATIGLRWSKGRTFETPLLVLAAGFAVVAVGQIWIVMTIRAEIQRRRETGYQPPSTAAGRPRRGVVGSVGHGRWNVASRHALRDRERLLNEVDDERTESVQTDLLRELARSIPAILKVVLVVVAVVGIASSATFDGPPAKASTRRECVTKVRAGDGETRCSRYRAVAEPHDAASEQTLGYLLLVFYAFHLGAAHAILVAAERSGEPDEPADEAASSYRPTLAQ